MKMQDIIKVATKNEINAGQMNKTQLIMAIQKSEGNNDCFATSKLQSYGQGNSWRLLKALPSRATRAMRRS
ncbi:MAG TPA: hypothetical protein VIO11_05840 [Candidatus Methanoperedens sp.]